MENIVETQINMVSEETEIQGEVVFDKMTRVHGTLKGHVRTKPGSVLILAETAVVEGQIYADTLFVEGFVQGDIQAKKHLVIAKTGRVVGNLSTPSLTIEFGAFFEGECRMEV